MTRVRHLGDKDLPGEFRAIFERLRAERGYIPSLYGALAQSPALLRDFIGITDDLRNETVLDARLRELAVLTVAQVTGAATMWLSHVPLARAAGLTDEQVLGLPVWRRHPSFSDEERAVIAYAEAVTRDARAPDDVWQAARAFLDEREMVELTLTAGFYNMVARFLEAVEVDVDPEYLDSNR
jgi:AhpD family alkylhydroperoxidase